MSKLLVDRAKKKLPERLASVRGDRSQRQFARELGVFQQNVNRYESGTTPHTDFLIQLAVREGISIDWLLLGKGRMRRGRWPGGATNRAASPSLRAFPCARHCTAALRLGRALRLLGSGLHPARHRARNAAGNCPGQAPAPPG